MKKLVLVLSVIFAALSVSAQAAEGNAEAGKAKAAICAACHSMDGNSMVPLYPKLAGQHAPYLTKQLHDFKSAATSGGKEGRNDPIMAGFVMALSDQDMADLAAYFASQKVTHTPAAEFPAIGKKLYEAGDAERGIPACMACHGPAGKGMGLAGFPSLTGQHATYIKSQLNKFKMGQRHNDLNGMMEGVAKKLNDSDIDAITQYIASLK
ncbi:cytochrome c4 [Shewanella sp. 202IG2-18]|uniref:c-type cytochrome n=1 Tax=Parashewanella hymeniacidonis TaxID=2807618 RepID=UPI00195FBCEE|nr:c-type cytochrome [Parashewanella hymeniacidonis]MBM7072573.1 cytochrome c4 [Parashewanella hymeniacidonis]